MLQPVAVRAGHAHAKELALEGVPELPFPGEVYLELPQRLASRMVASVRW